MTLGDDVKIDIIGINGNATGKVNVTKQQKQNQLYATGEITIDGTYLAYGHKLAVDPASVLTFNTSPIINPTLNLSASKLITNANLQTQQAFNLNSIRVGIQLTGTMNNPKLSLYSSPNTLSISDILSYLILGHLGTTSATNTTDSNTSTSSSNDSNQSFANIFDATKLLDTGFSGSQSAGISNTLQQSLGISELGIQTNSSVDVLGNEIEQEDYFVIGKYISPKLYIKYSQGLLYNDDILQLRYFITPHWILQTESARSTSIDNSSGVDILYSI